MVRGSPGKVAVSAVWYDENTNKLRSKFLGQHGANYNRFADAYAEAHPSDTKPAFVAAVDNEGGVLYSVGL